jgi:hypothetical protein
MCNGELLYLCKVPFKTADKKLVNRGQKKKEDGVVTNVNALYSIANVSVQSLTIYKRYHVIKKFKPVCVPRDSCLRREMHCLSKSKFPSHFHYLLTRLSAKNEKVLLLNIFG